MAAYGYVTHAARNRRFTALLLFAYVLAFELIGAFVLTMLLLIVDQEHTILSDPTGYALRYGLPVAVFSAWIFRRLYRSHAEAVIYGLGVRIVSRTDEPRFVGIAEQACTTLGVRLPRFGVLDAAEPNALTIGEGPNCGLIVVTRGMLDRLDDDELLAVLAHEASHIRQGDTGLLAANHALMRTAVLLQVHNPLRFEDWRQMILPLLLPPLLVVMLAGSATTMAAMTLARFARRGLKLGRDHIADGEAVRVTHFPEALLSALVKIGGHGAFAGSQRVEGALFDGPADHEGGTHPAIDARRQAITTLGRGLMDATRQRRDTREPSRARFGQARSTRRMLYPADATGRPLEQPPTASLSMLVRRFTDPDAHRQWQEACIAWCEWRATDGRNAIGLAPAMIIPVASIAMFLLVFWWPADRDLSKLAARLAPGALVEIARDVNSGPECIGRSYRDGICPEYRYSPAQLAAKRAKANEASAEASAEPTTSAPAPASSGLAMPLFLVLLIGLAAVSPKLMRRVVGVVDARSSTTDGQRQTRPDPPSGAPSVAPRSDGPPGGHVYPRVRTR
ncbi:M48 family metallopeptidase [Sphingomonas solaris]|uniref:M48 family metalloprotease n=1 Tax=Alterirhizorhabdus solaris TaxID=2529389 RepID=A0A558QRX7_9SPHN|nr:M48 family metalloprotease [Sphingomonas solaris]TVV69901.1 M48 family metalloprotease [Sphingomonas solaris]